ncbi:hypothetical protein CRX47_15325 [Clostridium sporogenes]|uniref:Four helix bundle protein n=1 Tax=Clostridium sporogenes TaxID=1509 RepID=A0ABX4K9B8_CLOSG|nr:hypothetical protein CRX47_15325 [Clostridium sporogenes]
MVESKILQKNEMDILLQDCKKICRILSSIVKTSKE